MLAFAMSGCAVYRTEPVAGNPKARTVQVDGQPVIVAPYSDGTWGATDTVGLPLTERNPALLTTKLRKAVEMVSGCKVTDTAYLPAWSNIVATVDCAK